MDFLSIWDRRDSKIGNYWMKKMARQRKTKEVEEGMVKVEALALELGIILNLR